MDPLPDLGAGLFAIDEGIERRSSFHGETLSKCASSFLAQWLPQLFSVVHPRLLTIALPLWTCSIRCRWIFFFCVVLFLLQWGPRSYGQQFSMTTMPLQRHCLVLFVSS